MAHKRVIRVLCYEGIDSWVEGTLERSKTREHRLKTLFTKKGTVSEIAFLELKDGERMHLELKAVPEQRQDPDDIAFAPIKGCLE